MSKARIYARNLAANWLGQAAGLVVLFFLSPFVVHTVGKAEYGILATPLNPTARLAFTRRRMAQRLASLLEEAMNGPRGSVAGRAGRWAR